MATVSTFNIALIASTGRFVSNMARAERQWNQFARSVQRQAKVLPQAIRDAVPASLALGRNVAKWTAVATAALGGLSAAGVKLAADFEQSQIAFETMLGDAERAQRFLRELEVYARRTPFGFVGLQRSARQLLAYGFTADRVLEMITPIGDTVAAMGGGQQMLEAIIRALGQIQAKGKLASQEFLQLTEQGVAAWQMLAEFLGVSVPEAMDLASRGAISSAVAIEAVLQGMTRRFAGAMTRQATTMAGRWEQVKDSITTIVRGFGQDVVRITGLATAMGVLADAIERVADAVSLHGFLGALERAFPPWVKPVIVGIAGAIIGGLVPAIVAWLIPALKKLGVSLWATLRPLTPWMAVGAAVALTAYVLARNWGNLAEVGQRVWTVLGGVAMYGASLVVRGSALIYQALSWIVPALRGTADSVMAYANSLRDSALQAIQSATASARVAQQAAASASTAEQAAQAQETLAAGLEAAQKAAEGGIQSFDEVHQVQESLLDSFEVPEFMPLDVALPELDATASMADGLVALEGVITSIGEAASRAWDRLTQSMEPVRRAVEWLRTNWPGLDTVLENTAAIITFTLVPAFMLAAARATWSAAQQVAAWVATQAQAIASIATQVANIAVLAARWIWLGAVSVAQGARVAAGWVIAMGPIGWAIAAAAALATAVVIYWDEIVAAVDVAHAWFEDNIKPIWDGIKEAVLTTWNTLRESASEIWDAILQDVQALHNWVSQDVPRVWDEAKTAIGEAWNTLANLASSAWSNIESAVKSVYDWAAQNLVASWETIRDGITGAWNTLSQTAGTVWNEIEGTIAAVWSWAEQQASQVWNAVVSIIEGAWNGLSETATRVWNDIKAAVEAVWTWAQENAQTLWQGVTAAIEGVWSGLSQAASTTWQTIRGAIESVWSWASEQASALWQGVSDTITGAWQTLSQTASGVWTGIKSVIKAVWDWASEQAGEVWGAVSTAITEVWNGLSTAATTAWEAIREAISTVWSWAETQAGAVWTAVRNSVEDAWNAVAETATTVWQSVRTAIEAVWTWAETTAASVWGAVVDVVTSTWDSLVSAATSTWAAIRGAIESAWDGLESWATSLWDDVSKAVAGAWEDILNDAERLWKSIRGAVTDGWDKAKKTVSDLVGEIQKSIEDMTKTVERLVDTLRQRVIGWWDDMKKSVTETAGDLVSGVTGFFQNLYNTLVGHSIVPDLVTNILGWFDQLKQGSTQSTFEWCNDINGLVGGLAASMKYSLSNTFDQLLSGAITFGEMFKSIFSNILDAVRRKIADFLAEKAVSALIGLLTGGATWAAGGGGFLGGIIGSVAKGIGGIVKGIGSIFGLASGGIVTAPTLALVGEGYRREAVIPLERDNVIAESVGAAVFDAMMTAHRFQQASGPGLAGDDREVVLRIDGATFARIILPHLVREGQRQGMDVVIRPALGV